MALLGHGVIPGSLTAPTHHEEVTVTHLDHQGTTPAPRPQRHPSRGTDRCDGHQGVVIATTADPIAMPCHRVVPVTVERASDSGEHLTVERQIVAVEGVSGPGQGRMGKPVRGAVAAEQAGNGDFSFVHLTSAGTPRNLMDKRVEHVIGLGQPTPRDLDPRSIAEIGVLGIAEGQGGLGTSGEQRGLVLHDIDDSGANVCSPEPRGSADLFEHREDLIAPAFELGGPDAVAFPQLGGCLGAA